MPRVQQCDFLIFWQNIKNAPDVTRQRMYLETMQDILPSVEKIYVMDEDPAESTTAVKPSAWRDINYYRPIAITSTKEQTMKQIANFLLVGLVLLGIVIIYDGFFIVEEGKQVMLTQFGRPIGTPKTSAGLYFKMPFLSRRSIYLTNESISGTENRTRSQPMTRPLFILT